MTLDEAIEWGLPDANITRDSEGNIILVEVGRWAH